MLVGFRFSQYIHTRPGAPSGAAATSPSVFAMSTQPPSGSLSWSTRHRGAWSAARTDPPNVRDRCRCMRFTVVRSVPRSTRSSRPRPLRSLLDPRTPDDATWVRGTSGDRPPTEGSMPWSRPDLTPGVPKISWLYGQGIEDRNRGWGPAQRPQRRRPSSSKRASLSGSNWARRSPSASPSSGRGAGEALVAGKGPAAALMSSHSRRSVPTSAST